MLQDGSKLCDGTLDCRLESIHLMMLLCSLCVGIVAVVCAFTFIREDKEEQITPLCPQLVVRNTDLKFQIPLDGQGGTFDVTCVDEPQDLICKVAMDWTDPFKTGTSGVAATVRLQNAMDFTVATVVARNVAVVGQSLALCRAGCEIFGFVEPDGDHRYLVRHRTGVHLLTLIGDFETGNIDGLNPVGAKVCTVHRVGGATQGRVLQHVDAGLVIASLLATRVHRLLAPATSLESPRPALGAPGGGTSADEEEGGAAPTLQGADCEAAPGSRSDPFLAPAAREGGEEEAPRAKK